MANPPELTVELAPSYDVVHLCGSSEGLRALAQRLMDCAEQGGEVMLTTEAHGGTELGVASRLQACRLVHKLALHCVKAGEESSSSGD
jgi:hypothetical protein